MGKHDKRKAADKEARKAAKQAAKRATKLTKRLAKGLELADKLGDGGNDMLSSETVAIPATALPAEQAPPPLTAFDLAGIERNTIIKALDAASGNRQRTAEMLGMQRSNLYKKIDRYQLK